MIISMSSHQETYEELKTPLMHLFKLSLSTEFFPDKLKIASVSAIFNNGAKDLLTNY